MSVAQHEFVLKLSCEDRPGIVAAITAELVSLGANIAESNQFWDRYSNRFFMRLQFVVYQEINKEHIDNALAPVIERFAMSANLLDFARIPKVILMVSKFDHALIHLLYQIRVKWMRAEVAAIVSNHLDARLIADHEKVPFYHFPVTPDTKLKQEQSLLDLMDETGAEVVVLARYMQILSDSLSRNLSGKAINIHHSFLPSFKGAKPYHQAHERGVKIIGATAHYVTADLDEGPIIEQETQRVTHAMTPEDFVATGRDIESQVLARALKFHLEGRVMLHGNKTIVFA